MKFDDPAVGVLGADIDCDIRGERADFAIDYMAVLADIAMVDGASFFGPRNEARYSRGTAHRVCCRGFCRDAIDDKTHTGMAPAIVDDNSGTSCDSANISGSSDVSEVIAVLDG